MDTCIDEESPPVRLPARRSAAHPAWSSHARRSLASSIHRADATNTAPDVEVGTDAVPSDLDATNITPVRPQPSSEAPRAPKLSLEVIQSMQVVVETVAAEPTTATPATDDATAEMTSSALANVHRKMGPTRLGLSELTGLRAPTKPSIEPLLSAVNGGVTVSAATATSNDNAVVAPPRRELHMLSALVVCCTFAVALVVIQPSVSITMEPIVPPPGASIVPPAAADPATAILSTDSAGTVHHSLPSAQQLGMVADTAFALLLPIAAPHAASGLKAACDACGKAVGPVLGPVLAPASRVVRAWLHPLTSAVSGRVSAAVGAVPALQRLVGFVHAEKAARAAKTAHTYAKALAFNLPALVITYQMRDGVHRMIKVHPQVNAPELAPLLL